MKVESSKLDNGDMEVKLTFDSHDQLCLNHDLLDIVEWYSKGPSFEKIFHCRSKLIKEYRDMLLQSDDFQSKTMAEVNKILSDDVEMCEMICRLPGYKNRAQREMVVFTG